MATLAVGQLRCQWQDQSECTSTLNEFFFRNKAIYYFGDRGGDVDDTAASAATATAAATRQTGRNLSFRRRARPPPVSSFSSLSAHEFVIWKTSTLFGSSVLSAD